MSIIGKLHYWWQSLIVVFSVGIRYSYIYPSLKITVTQSNRTQLKLNLLEVYCSYELECSRIQMIKLHYSFWYKDIRCIFLGFCLESKSLLLNKVLILLIVPTTIQNFLYLLLFLSIHYHGVQQRQCMLFWDQVFSSSHKFDYMEHWV